MRWLVEVSALGKTDLQKFCVEAESWQRALQAARSQRGEDGPMSGFSIELLEEGYRAVDPLARVRFVVKRAPDDMPITAAPPREPKGGVAPSASVAPPAPAAPAAPAAGRTNGAASVAGAASGNGEMSRDASNATTVPTAAPLAVSVSPASPAAAAPAAPPSASNDLTTPNLVPSPSSSSPARKGPPRPGASVPPPAAGQPAQTIALGPTGDHPGTNPMTHRPALPAVGAPLPGLPPVKLLVAREQDPSDSSPLTYREYAFAVPEGTSEELCAQVLQGQLRYVEAHVAGAKTGKLVNLAVFDVEWAGKPPRPPIATLTWKDWKGDAVIGYPRRGGASKPPRPPSKMPPSMQAAAEAAAAVVAIPQQPPPPQIAEAVPPTAPIPTAPPPPPELAPTAVQPAPLMSAEPPPPPLTAPMVAVAAPAYGHAPEATAIMAPPAPIVPQVVAPQSVQPNVPQPAPQPVPQMAPQVVPQPAHVPQTFPPPPPEPVMTEADPTRRPSQHPMAAAGPGMVKTPSGRFVRGRISGDELITSLFESMHDLHFLRDALDGGQFCLALATEVLPARAAIIHFFDLEKREWVVACTRGKDTQRLLTMRSGEGDEILREAARKRRALVVPDAANATPERYRQISGARSLIAAPIMQAGRALGALEIINPLDGMPFTEDEGNAMTYIAEQFAEYLGSRGIVLDRERISAAAAR